jgi:hypothetical protein
MIYAVRCNSGHPNGFRVGPTVYSNKAWKLEESLTAEHEFAFEHGALAIVQVTDAADPALLPYPVEEGQATLLPERTVSDLASQVASQQAQIQSHLAQITSMQLHIEALANERAEQVAQIATLTAKVMDQERRLAGVAAEVANFPQEPAGSPSPVAAPGSPNHFGSPM